MYATQKNQIRGLSKREYNALRLLCRLSKNLYNVGLYNVRQYYIQERKHLRYESNYHYSKENDNYKLLNTDVAQQTLKVVDRSFRSFYGLIKKARNNEYRFHDVKLPRYLPKDGYFPLIIPRIRVKDGFLYVPMSLEFKKEHGDIKIPFPERLANKIIKEVRIHPKYNARFFEIEYVYVQDEEPKTVDPDSALAIDFGLDNLAACIDTNGASFLIDGRPLKSINRWYNKRNARLQSIKDLQGIKGTTEQQARLTMYRNNYIRDYLNKSARYIVNHCIEHCIGKIIVGVNPEWKQDINIGKRNNQNFVQIPHWSLRCKLEGLCQRYGIQYVEQEESYTSKASFLDQDDLPIYNADNPQQYTFSGKRVKRGLYRASDGQLVNADINGAANILRKSNHRLNFERVARGLLANPLRVKLS
ncbi:RNA-guided endonuclease InsQ/TnpB family protein [Alicyclobacillus shizuokensis]|uniref:RNA-guided endonuclease InsQ/TnpB family protein n=1 Tax=Alicyclobacillus shizuokensis TaxID=392014 RepID=UPI000832B8D9|nr:RNA-guided endonuclease TnpB family protein [Alicyclobacillus shizuokensis]